MRNGHSYSIKGMIFAFFASNSGVLDCSWPTNFFKNGDCFSFSSSQLDFLAKQYVPNDIFVGFSVLKSNFQHVRACFALFTVVETGSYVG